MRRGFVAFNREVPVLILAVFLNFSSDQGLRESQLRRVLRRVLPDLAAQVHHRQEGSLHPEVDLRLAQGNPSYS